jgi:uncharacterized protein (DUF1697 family)
MLALLRGINVGGNRLVPMERLRTLAGRLGLANPTTLIASGNLLFQTSSAPSAVEAQLEAVIEQEFGFFVEVMVRTSAQWQALFASNPFQDAALQRPKLLHVAISKRPFAAGMEDALTAVAAPPERIAVVDEALWVDFANGVGRSKLTPKALDKAAGSTVTARNLATATKLSALLEGSTG